MEVPTATSLHDIYPEDAIDVQEKRWENLLQCFKNEFGDLPEYVARSPGRVNLIGEVRLRWKISLMRYSIEELGEESVQLFILFKYDVFNFPKSSAKCCLEDTLLLAHAIVLFSMNLKDAIPLRSRI